MLQMKLGRAIMRLMGSPGNAVLASTGLLNKNRPIILAQKGHALRPEIIRIMGLDDSIMMPF